MAEKHKHDDEKALKASAEAHEEAPETKKAESEAVIDNNSCCSCSNSGDYKGC